jgi:hypothetical protein
LRRRFLTGFAIAAILIGLGIFPALRASADSAQFSDDFQQGFTVGNAGDPNVNWFYFAGGGFVGNDGITTTGPDGLTVVPKGVNPNTGKPAFTLTVGQNSPLPGTFDHVKWLVYANHFAQEPDPQNPQNQITVPGFAAPDSGEVVCQATVSGQTFGTADNPFHQYVQDPNDDLRLAAVALPNIDFATYSVFDTWVTNQHIWAFYERLPFDRQNLGGSFPNDTAAYSSAVPIYKRSLHESDTVDFAYNKSTGTARWLINGVERWRVNVPIGTHPSPDATLIDHGGIDKVQLPNGIDCGMGMFTLLDGYGPHGKGLVRLNSPLLPAQYYVPGTVTQPGGTGTAEQFVDDNSLPQDRLWGQGAELHVSNFSVQYWDN